MMVEPKSTVLLSPPPFSPISKRDRFYLAALTILVGFASYGIGHFVLQGFPNSADEHAYLFQAQLFSEGRLWIPAHPKQEFLSPFYIFTHEGKVFSLFPPGWPLILAVGVLLGIPDWVNPILGGISLWVVFAIANRLWGRRPAWISVGLLIFSPFYLFNNASFFSHPVCLLAILSTIWALLGWERTTVAYYAFFAGLTASFSFTIREYTSILVLTVPILGVFWNTGNKRKYLFYFFLGVLPLLLFCLYNNHALTGNMWIPARFLQPSEWLGFGDREIRVFDYREIQHYGWSDGIHHLLENGKRLFIWTLPGLPLLAFFGGWMKRQERWYRYFVISIFLLITGYLLYPSDGGNQYGPRFYYESLVYLIFCSIPAWQWIGRRLSGYPWNAILLGLLILFELWVFVDRGTFFRHQIYQRTALYRLVEFQKIHQAIVFVASPSGDMTQGDLIRNPVSLQDADVIYAWNLGDRNRELAEFFPHRIYYLFRRDSQSGFMVLQRLSL